MTRYLLDTNIVSDVVKTEPSASLVEWLASRKDADLHIASFTLAEIRRGILQMPAGKRRQALEDWYGGPEGPTRLFSGRILSFDAAGAEIWARLMSEGRAAGRPRNPLDMLIASVALANDCVIVTGNERDFAGIPFFNPASIAT